MPYLGCIQQATLKEDKPGKKTDSPGGFRCVQVEPDLELLATRHWEKVPKIFHRNFT